VPKVVDAKGRIVQPDPLVGFIEDEDVGFAKIVSRVVK
jgi:hypothetical protein